MDINISPELILARERQRRQRGVFAFLAVAVAAVTVMLLINPATTQEYEPVCGIEAHTHGPECSETVTRLICPIDESPGHVHDDSCYEIVRTCVCGFEDGDEEHEHTPECFVEERKLICPLPEGEVHVHTEACLAEREELICGLEDDPDHEHTPDCFRTVTVFACEAEPGVGHVHNELCYETEEVLTCTLPEHEHTDACYPKLTGDPHADVEIDLDWESTFCNVPLTGDWAEDLVAIAGSQIGYAESERNFVTDEYNVRHGYTRYGDWYGTRYAGWNAIYVMFCLHYADVWSVPADPVPANWMNSARAREDLWLEADGEPLRGDLVFFDDNADGRADRVAIVTDVTADEITVILGGTNIEVHEETIPRGWDGIAGYLALPVNPDTPEPAPDGEIITLEAQLAAALPDTGEKPEGEEIADGRIPLADLPALAERPGDAARTEDGEITLTAYTADGRTVTLRAAADSLPYPAEELFLTAEPLTPDDVPAMTDAIRDGLTADGYHAADLLLYDITVWRDEPVYAELPAEPEPAAETPAEPAEPAEPAAETPEAGERTLSLGQAASDIMEPIRPGDPVTPVSPDRTAVEVPAERPMDASPEIPEELPEETPAAAAAPVLVEIRRVPVTPEGPYEVTVDGFDPEEEMQVWRETAGGPEALTPNRIGDRVTVTTWMT